MKKSTVLAVLFGITGILNAQDAVTHQFDSFKGKCAAATLDGSKVFETQAPAIVTAQKCVEVNPAKTYILSGEFKAAGQGTGLYFGIISYDEDMQEIKAQNINAFENTLTELSEPAKAGSRTIKVRSAANWKAVPANFFAAFNADENFKDLPNFNLLPVKAINENEITLGAPLSKAYPAGTKIRMHRAGSGWTYCAAANKPLSVEWTTFTGKIKGSGFHRKGGEFYDRFRPGTRLVVPALTLRNTGKEPVKVFFRNLKLEEMK